MFDILKAMEYLHSMSPPIIHRDIKPENILINKKVLQIADFGWSNENDNKDFRNTFCGTPDYLAPEMILGNGHNEKLDMWTLGILMYELLHGKPPFTPKIKKPNRRMQQREIEKNILAGNIEFDKNISKECLEVMIALLNNDKDKRPSANEVLNFPFFIKRKQYLTSRSQRQSEKSVSSMQLENENKELKKKIEELEKKLREKENNINQIDNDYKNLQKHAENLEERLKTMDTRGSRRYLKGSYNSSVGVLNESNGRSFNDESLPKKNSDKLSSIKGRGKKLEIERLKRENKDLREKLDKEDLIKKETENSLKNIQKDLKNSRELNIKFFDKHKFFSTLISEFYEIHYKENNTDSKSRDQLDFDDMNKKLQLILEKFKIMKSKLKTPQVSSYHEKSYSFQNKNSHQTYSTSNLPTMKNSFNNNPKSSNSIRENVSQGYTINNAVKSPIQNHSFNYSQNASNHGDMKSKSKDRSKYYQVDSYLNKKKTYHNPSGTSPYLQSNGRSYYSPKSNKSNKNTPEKKKSQKNF